jgi:hypothetical protein
MNSMEDANSTLVAGLGIVGDINKHPSRANNAARPTLNMAKKEIL